MNKLINAVGGPKIAILIAVVLAALVIFGVTIRVTGAVIATKASTMGMNIRKASKYPFFGL